MAGDAIAKPRPGLVVVSTGSNPANVTSEWSRVTGIPRHGVGWFLTQA